MTAAQGEVAEEGATSGPKLWVILARAHDALADFVEASVAAKGLCLSDFMVLEVLLHKGPMAISEIGAKVLLANASMTAAVDRLERRDLVKRSFSAEDRRVRVVELTKAGKTLITALYQRHAEDIEQLMQVLGPGEREQLRESLKKLGLAAEAKMQHARPAREAVTRRRPAAAKRALNKQDELPAGR